jgi:hypothetical protein
MVLSFSMVNRSNLSFSYAVQRTAAGFSTNSWEWSTTGTNWTPVGSITNIPTSFGVVGFSNISNLDGASNAFLRVTFNGATNSSGNNRLDNIQLQAVATGTSPSVQASGNVNALSTTYGTASGAGSFSVSGQNLTEGIQITAPTGFEISKTLGGASGYASNQVVGAAGTVASTSIYVRLASNTPAGTYSGDVVCNSTGSSGASITIPNSTVAKKNLSILGLTADSKVYDGTTVATFSGTPAYDGLVNGDSFVVSGSPTASFNSAAAGNGKTVTVTGYNPPSGNYNVLATPLTANITVKPLNISGLSGVSKVYDGTMAATLTGTPSLSGIESVDSGNISLTGSPAAAFSSANVGVDIGITVSGYSLEGSAAFNYSVVPPADLTGDITLRPATVTASNRTKTFGQSLDLGPNQIIGFITSGLVAGEKVDRVTLTASGGTAAEDATGSYTITPSDANALPSIPPNPFRSENYFISYVAGTLTVVDAITISDWAANNGLTGTDAAPEADPDGDGMSNLMEFYLGLSPTNSLGAGGGFVMTNGPSNTVSMTYLRAKGVTGVTPAVQASADLSSSNNWGTNGVVETVKDAADPRYEEVTATVTNPPGATKMFMRLRVSQP